MCLQDLARYHCWDSAFGVSGRGRSPIESADPRVRRAGRQGRTVSGTVSLHSCKREMGGWGAETVEVSRWLPGRVDFYAQARRIWPRAAPGLRWGRSGAPGGVREGFRSSCWALRRAFWISRELNLESPRAVWELPRFCCPLGSNVNYFERTETILNCSLFNF